MNDLFLLRMRNKGEYVGEALKNQSDVIMDKTFFNDPVTKPVHVYHPFKKIDVDTYAKYQINSKFSILKDQVDYHLQFRTKEHYPIGCYVDLPDDTGTINTWLIVGKDDNPQFVKYSILQCNWEFKWIVNGIIQTVLGVLRTRNSYNAGVWNDGFTTTVENQNSFWVPTTPITQTIYYDTRFLISEKREIPLSFYVTKIEDTYPIGITKVVLKQDLFNPEWDSADLMIADYYKSNITPEEPSNMNQNITPRIDISSWKSPKIVLGSDYRDLVGKFYNDDVEIDASGQWTHDIPYEILDKFSILTEVDPMRFRIKCDKDYSLVNTVITITLIDSSGKYYDSQKIEVVAR